LLRLQDRKCLNHPHWIYFQGIGILTPLPVVDFLGDLRLSFGMVMILTISQKSPGTRTIMITIDTSDSKTIYSVYAAHPITHPMQIEKTQVLSVLLDSTSSAPTSPGAMSGDRTDSHTIITLLFILRQLLTRLCYICFPELTFLSAFICETPYTVAKIRKLFMYSHLFKSQEAKK